jgi:hypothetical protein
MRFASMLVVLLMLTAGGCSKVKKELDTPGPAPPPNPKEAAIDPALIEHSADDPLESDSPPDPLAKPVDESRPRQKTY